MADNPLPRYFFGVPPEQYDPDYMRELVRVFSLFQEQLTNPGKVTASELNLRPDGAGIRQFSDNRAAYDAGLLPGDVWTLSTGEIRIVVDPNVVVPAYVEYYRQATGEVGQLITFDASAEILEGMPLFFSPEGKVGDVTIDAVSTYPPTGLAATGAVGSVILNIISVSGQSGTTSVNAPTVTGTSTLTLTGVNLAGSVGSVTTNV